MNAYTKKGYEASKEYKARSIKRVPLDMLLTDYEDLKAAADKAGEPVNTFIKAAIRERIARLSADKK